MTLVPITGEIAKKASEEAKWFLEKLLGPACEEAGALVGDHLRLFRLKRQIALLQKTEHILAEKGLEPKAVNLKALLPLIETAALEDDEAMSDRWASLLAHAADPTTAPSCETAFIEILKQLPPVHAFILTVFYEQIKIHAIPTERWHDEGIVVSDLQKGLRPDDKRELSDSEFNIAIDNLRRLNLIGYPAVSFGKVNGHEVRVHTLTADILCPTHLGKAFFDACSKIPRGGCGYGIPRNSISNVYAMDIWPTLPITERLGS